MNVWNDEFEFDIYTASNKVSHQWVPVEMLSNMTTWLEAQVWNWVYTKLIGFVSLCWAIQTVRIAQLWGYSSEWRAAREKLYFKVLNSMLWKNKLGVKKKEETKQIDKHNTKRLLNHVKINQSCLSLYLRKSTTY